MNVLFLKLLNMSISASWLVLAVLILRLVLKKAPKWIHVLLWGIVAVRLLCPFSIESVLSLIPSVETVPMNIELEATPAIDSGIDIVNRVINPVLSASFTPHPAASANPLQIWIPLASVLWIAGMAVLLLYTIISYWHLRYKVSTAVRYQEGIFQSEHVASPFVLGILKPRIYLPFHISEQDLTHVIAHEQAHIHRRDHWWKPLGFLLLTVYWFNPLMWLAYVLLCRDIELACDEKVIQALGSQQRADYTQALVTCSVSRRRIAACPLAFGEVSVKDRVKSVLHYKKPGFWIVLLAVILCVAVAVCFLTDPATSVDERLAVFIDCAIASHHQSEKSADHFCCLDWEVLGKERSGNRSTVYMWVLYEEFSNDNGLTVETGSHIFTAITAEKKDGTYHLVEYWEPKDGGYYEDSIKEKVPMHLWSEAMDARRYMEKQSATLLQMAQEHFDSSADSETATFQAKLLEIHDGYYLVEPVEGSWEKTSASRIEVPMQNMDPSPEPQVGDLLEISHNGQILETFPARLQEVYSIKVIQEAVLWDLIPMVMVDGVLYLDTGYNSTATERTDHFDGQITSQVSGSEQPTANDQSNFGTGYGYQYGATAGTIELNMNGKWRIFATEEARQQLQFPENSSDSAFMVDPVLPVSIENLVTGTQKTITSNEDVRTIQLLFPDVWAEGTTRCMHDYKITINGVSYLYHSDCGTFTDTQNDCCFSLSDQEQEELNKLLPG